MRDRTTDPSWVFDAYAAVRTRLPTAEFGDRFHRARSLADIAAPFDVLLLDAYGVLNIGERPIPGAAKRIADLRRAGKRIMVVTNSAAYPKRLMMVRYRRLGFHFEPHEVVSSREALLGHLSQIERRRWGVMLSPHHGQEEFETLDAEFLGDDPGVYSRVEGFLLIGSDEWSEARQKMLETALMAQPRPVLVGNPDIVAPREAGLSLEPGHYAHRIADATGIRPEFFGKPFRHIFDLALSRLSPRPAPERVLMVGDTLHTDILGARTMGFSAALVTDYGALAGADVAAAVKAAGIVPNFVIEVP